MLKYSEKIAEHPRIDPASIAYWYLLVLRLVFRTFRQGGTMLKTGLLSAFLIAAEVAPVAAQQSARHDLELAMYAAALRALPDDVADRRAVVDPRIVRGRFAVDPIAIWDQLTVDAQASPTVAQLPARLPDVQFCQETPLRTACLHSSDDVHVMFGESGAEQNVARLEITLAGRIMPERQTFFIETWLYIFDLTPEGPVITERTRLGQGHGGPPRR